MHSMTPIALVTCDEIKKPMQDDLLLQELMRGHGFDLTFCSWSDPSGNWSKYKAAIVRSTWDYHKKYHAFSNWLQNVSKQTRLVNSFDCLKWNIDKLYLKELERADIRIVDTLWLKELSDFSSLKVPQAWKTVVVKPTVSATSDLTFKMTREDFLKTGRSIIENILQRSAVMVQPFLDSILTNGELSLLMWNLKDKPKFQYAVLKKPKAGDYRVQYDFGGNSELTTLISDSSDIVKFGNKIVSTVPHDWDYARVDILDWDTEPKLGELELFEPDLFLRYKPEAAKTLAEHLAKKIAE